MLLMKINKEEFLKPLQSVAGIVERRHTLPILSNVLLQISNDNIAFVATDLEIQITAILANNSDKGDAAITVSAKKLQDIVRALPENAEISFDSKDSRLQLKEGKSQFSQNGAKEGVVTTESGLQYKIVSAGTGPKPTKDDTVKVHYRGTLIDGTEFDSSYKRGEPVNVPVGGVIPGWVEALQLMPVGSKWELYIPSELAYGPGGDGGQIGPNAVLQFEVELLGIEAPEQSPAAETTE